ncbi:MAG TPA: ribonuclease R, partial [Microvirga sp.]|nr:ribonuclease R [Microvirga sp.]
MAKRSKAHSSSTLPSREDLVTFIAETPGKVGKREIAQAFNIKGGDRIWLKQMLKELEDEGAVNRRGKRVHKAGQLPPMVMADIVKRDR